MEEEQLTSVFTRMRERLRISALRLLGQTDDADDALQDAFMRLWHKRNCIDTDHDAESLAGITVKNISIDMLRRRNLRFTVSIDEEQVVDNDGQMADHDVTERRERFAEVKQLIDKKLSAQTRDILIRKEYKGESVRKIAQDTGLTEAAVSMQLSRARKLIRNEYRRLKDEEDR